MIYKKVIRNKKGDISINILVMLTLAITIYSLFIFVSGANRIVTAISGIEAVEQIYLERNLVDFSINRALKDAVVESYFEVIDLNDYLWNPSVNSIEPEFGRLHPEVNEKLKVRVVANMRKYFTMVYRIFPEQYFLRNTRNSILLSDSFEESNLVIEGDNIQMNLYQIYFGANLYKSFSVEYFATFSPMVSPNKIGLHGFNEIYEAKELCKNEGSSSSMERCFQTRLENFYVVVEEKEKNNEKYFLVSMESFEIYFVKNRFQKLSFQFIPK